MRTIFTVFFTALACLVLFGIAAKALIPKQTDITVQPGQAQIIMGPSTKRVDVLTPKGLHLFSLNIKDDGKILRLKSDADQHIRVEPRP